MNKVARRELVTPKMEMTLMILMLMEVMTVEMEEMVEMVVMMEEMVEMEVMIVMMITMHCWLRGGPRRSTMTWRGMPTTTPSFSHLYIATTPEALFSTGGSIGPTPTTSASGRYRCSSERGLGCATSTVPLLHGSHVRPSSGMQLDKR